MEITKKSLREISKRVEKLKQLEDELKEFSGFAISITRLTILKYLCRDSFGMCEFAFEISKKTKPRITYKNGDKEIKKIVEQSVKLMEKIIQVSIRNNQLTIKQEEVKQISSLSREYWKYQNEIKRVSWTNVRQIKNWQVFLIEQALDCFKYPNDPKRGYELGRSYTEKYEPKHGTGLITESLEFVGDIRVYWETYYQKKVQE